MLMSADKVGGWVKKRQKHADVILVCPPTKIDISWIGDNPTHTDRFLVEMCHNYAFKE